MDEDLDATLARALAALRPIDVYREQQARREHNVNIGQDTLPEPSPETPVAEVP